MTNRSPSDIEARPTSHLLARERFTGAEMADIRRDFSMRLASIFPDANTGDVARRLYTTYATVRPYERGERLPIAEMLLQIHRVTGVNIHWLLTGDGPRRVEGEDLFDLDTEDRIREVAGRRGISFEDAVRELVGASLETLAKFEP